MESNRLAGSFAIFMLIASVPYGLFIATFGQIIVSYEPGTPSVGSSLGVGVMMIFFCAYGIALISYVMGLIYFGYIALRYKVFPKTWHWLTICYSTGLVISPVILFFP